MRGRVRSRLSVHQATPQILVVDSELRIFGTTNRRVVPEPLLCLDRKLILVQQVHSLV